MGKKKLSKMRRFKAMQASRNGRPRRYLQIDEIDYRDIATLRRFVTDRGKLRSRRITGASRKQQRDIAKAVKRARELGLLPYIGEGSDK